MTAPKKPQLQSLYSGVCNRNEGIKMKDWKKKRPLKLEVWNYERRATQAVAAQLCRAEAGR